MFIHSQIRVPFLEVEARAEKRDDSTSGTCSASNVIERTCVLGMSEPTTEAPIRRVETDGPADQYDHAISLIDTSESQTDLETTETQTPGPSWRTLASKESVRQQLARRKYAKWQQESYTGRVTEPAQEEEDAPRRPAISRNNSAEVLGNLPAREHDVSDLAQDPGVTEEERQHGHDKTRRKPKKKKEQDYEVDVLYENQRGAWFCGIPLFSHSSLLNFDPSPWITKDLKDSAVNITNAQVPDPSWIWAWKSWYVDMSYDVDEEGWQYSFSFSRQFVWHGSHPWFHSFVRRRRWLRKRVKRDMPGNEKAGTLSAAHRLNTDYFTIHSKRERSPASQANDGATKTARPDSYTTPASTDDTLRPPDDLSNVPNLLRALKLASVDRAKIEHVKQFVNQGGEEVAYLKDHIPEIMNYLVFQNSRRQLLGFLKQTADNAQTHLDEHDADDKPEGKAESRRIDNLLGAINATEKEIGGLEYWSDRQHVLKTNDDDEESQMPGRNLEKKAPVEIRGIPAAAEIAEPDDTKLPALLENDDHVKGKRKDVGDGDEKEAHTPMSSEPEGGPRLREDSIFIPEDDYDPDADIDELKAK